MNKQQLANKIWESANKMRSKIEANEYKDYILGFIFYEKIIKNIFRIYYQILIIKYKIIYIKKLNKIFYCFN